MQWHPKDIQLCPLILYLNTFPLVSHFFQLVNRFKSIQVFHFGFICDMSKDSFVFGSCPMWEELCVLLVREYVMCGDRHIWDISSSLLTWHHSGRIEQGSLPRSDSNRDTSTSKNNICKKSRYERLLEGCPWGQG